MCAQYLWAGNFSFVTISVFLSLFVIRFVTVSSCNYSDFLLYGKSQTGKPGTQHLSVKLLHSSHWPYTSVCKGQHNFYSQYVRAHCHLQFSALILLECVSGTDCGLDGTGWHWNGCTVAITLFIQPLIKWCGFNLKQWLPFKRLFLTRQV